MEARNAAFMSEAPDQNQLLNQIGILAQSRGLRPPAEIIREREILEASRKPKRPKKKIWWVW